MRIKIRYNQDGDRKTKRTFLLFPKQIGNEIRWLEWTSWEQIYVVSKDYTSAYWIDLGWLDASCENTQPGHSTNEQ